MKHLKRPLAYGGSALILTLLLAAAYLLFWYPRDVSASQTENRLVFGATYMTMNNPYYQVLDDQLRAGRGCSCAV